MDTSPPQPVVPTADSSRRSFLRRSLLATVASGGAVLLASQAALGDSRGAKNDKNEKNDWNHYGRQSAEEDRE